jgi:phenylacetate-CoA ligase
MGSEDHGLLARATWSARVIARGPWQGRIPYRPAGVIARRRDRRVRHSVVHAWRHVPFYREAMRRIGLAPEDISCAADLAKLPLIDRDQVQSDPDRFVSDAAPRETLRAFPTSGTYGQPMRVLYDGRAILEIALHEERVRAVLRKLIGKPIRHRELFFATAHHAARQLGQEYRERSLLPRGLRVSMHASPAIDSPEEMLDVIAATRPNVIAGYGSSMEALFVHALATDADLGTVKVVRYSGDELSDPIKEVIRRRFRIPVIATYNSIEAPAIGFECESNRGLHQNEDLYPVRVIGAGGEEVREGEAGDVVISNLVNRGTVLLNYRLADRVRRLPGRCPCGRRLPLISHPEGRSDDWLRTTDGGRLHAERVRMLCEEQPFHRYQIVQSGSAEFVVFAVPGQGCERASVQSDLLKGFRDLFGVDASVDLRLVDSLPRTPSGKTRAVIVHDGAVADAPPIRG